MSEDITIAKVISISYSGFYPGICVSHGLNLQNAGIFHCLYENSKSGGYVLIQMFLLLLILTKIGKTDHYLSVLISNLTCWFTEFPQTFTIPKTKVLEGGYLVTFIS